MQKKAEEKKVFWDLRYETAQWYGLDPTPQETKMHFVSSDAFLSSDVYLELWCLIFADP